MCSTEVMQMIYINTHTHICISHVCTYAKYCVAIKVHMSSNGKLKEHSPIRPCCRLRYILNKVPDEVGTVRLTEQSHSVWRHVTTTCCSIIAFDSCFFQFSGWIIAGILTPQLIKTESPESCKPKSSECCFDPRQPEISDLKKCKVLTPSTLGTV